MSTSRNKNSHSKAKANSQRKRLPPAGSAAESEKCGSASPQSPDSDWAFIAADNLTRASQELTKLQELEANAVGGLAVRTRDSLDRARLLIAQASYQFGLALGGAAAAESRNLAAADRAMHTMTAARRQLSPVVHGLHVIAECESCSSVCRAQARIAIQDLAFALARLDACLIRSGRQWPVAPPFDFAAAARKNLSSNSGTVRDFFDASGASLSDRPPTGKPPIAICIGCGCDDECACVSDAGIACGWIYVDREAAIGICNQCQTPGDLPGFNRTYRAYTRVRDLLLELRHRPS